MRPTSRSFNTLFAFVAFAGTIFGQVPVPAAAAAPAPYKIGGVTVTGSLRSRLYVWDWFEPTTGNNEYAYSGNLLRIDFAAKRKSLDWEAEFAVPFIFGLPSTATAPAPQGGLGLGSNYYANSLSSNTAMIFPKQLYVRFHGLGLSDAHTLRFGRIDFQDGNEIAPKNASLATIKRDRVNQRLIGPFGFTDIQRSFDGVNYVYSKPTNNVTVLAATPTRGVFQTDGWGWNRIGFAYASWTHEWGTGKHSADTRLFAIEYDDFRHVLKVDNRSAAAKRGDTENIRINTFGGHSVHAYETSAGSLDLLLWGALQTGRWGTQKQLANAFDVEGGIQPKMLPRLKPWLRGGFFTSSGDDNPNDNKHETFFQLLPTARPFARFPFFNMMNNQDRFGILILRPHSKITTSSEFHALRLNSANDLWYSGGGAFQPWTFGYTGRATSGTRSLGNLYDTSVEYRANRKVTFTAYLGYAQGRAVLQQIYPKGKDGRFGYLELLYRL